VVSIVVRKEGGSFLLGFDGKMIKRIHKLSGATVNVIEKEKEPQSRVDISGTPEERRLGKKYVQFICQPNHGMIKASTIEAGDKVSYVRVPPETVSYGNHSKQGFLRMVEDEWSILLFFVDEKECKIKLPSTSGRPGAKNEPINSEMIAIFGPDRNRQGAKLKIMATVETKQPGYFSKLQKEKRSTKEGFDVEIINIGEENYSYALGRLGSTRKKLARASNCIVEYIGVSAWIAGDRAQRRLARDYLHWLLLQVPTQLKSSSEPMPKIDYENRDDITMVMLPRHCIGYITGIKGGGLRQIEEETGTFCFIEGGAVKDDFEDKPLLICGSDAADRALAESLVYDKISTKLDESWPNFDRGGKGKKKGKGKGKREGREGKGSPDTALTPEAQLFPRRPWRDKSKCHQELIDVCEDTATSFSGPQAKMKKRIGHLSGAYLEIKNTQMEIFGTKEEVERAKKYISLVTRQRAGSMSLSASESEQHDDLTILVVPADAATFVTGKQGSFLRLVEDEYLVLLFFLDGDKTPKKEEGSERVAIFGQERHRRAAELKIMAAIEAKKRGHYTASLPKKLQEGCPDGFGTDTLPIEDEDYSYALGKSGATRKKIARASQCIIEYVGRVAYLSGTKLERQRAREYLCWLFQQRMGSVDVQYQGRSDVTAIQVPKECVGYVTGHKGASLRSVEDLTGTFCFIEGGREDARDPKPLLICGLQDESRKKAEDIITARIEQKLEKGWVHHDDGDRIMSKKYSGSWNDRERPQRESRYFNGSTEKTSAINNAISTTTTTNSNNTTNANNTTLDTNISTGSANRISVEERSSWAPEEAEEAEGKEEEQVSENEVGWGNWGGDSDSCSLLSIDDNPAVVPHEDAMRAQESESSPYRPAATHGPESGSHSLAAQKTEQKTTSVSSSSRPLPAPKAAFLPTARAESKESKPKTPTTSTLEEEEKKEKHSTAALLNPKLATEESHSALVNGGVETHGGSISTSSVARASNFTVTTNLNPSNVQPQPPLTTTNLKSMNSNTSTHNNVVATTNAPSSAPVSAAEAVMNSHNATERSTNDNNNNNNNNNNAHSISTPATTTTARVVKTNGMNTTATTTAIATTTTTSSSNAHDKKSNAHANINTTSDDSTSSLIGVASTQNAQNAASLTTTSTCTGTSVSSHQLSSNVAPPSGPRGMMTQGANGSVWGWESSKQKPVAAKSMAKNWLKPVATPNNQVLEDEPLPPQLLHEEAWPELGQEVQLCKSGLKGKRPLKKP